MVDVFCFSVNCSQNWMDVFVGLGMYVRRVIAVGCCYIVQIKHAK
uniref:Uncharacterized protein n=1 Tax=Anguilla anguilla TaxID=7936 RepID=A0A0E9WHE2_ANGAN